MMPYTVFILNFMKASSAVNYLYVHTDDGGAEALLFAAVCVSCRKMRRKVLHDGNSVIKVCTCLYCTSNNTTKTGILHMS